MDDRLPYPAKRRALRVELSQLVRPTANDRWKRRLAIGAVLLAAGYFGLSWLYGKTTEPFSPGDLASCHAMWDNRCQKCHTDFQPVRADAFGIDRATADAMCQSCHAAPAHSRLEIASEVQSCAACHRDHQGRDFDLTRVADSNCTQCHQNISLHSKPDSAGKTTLLPNVESFVDDHPAFTSIKQDPGKLKFSHSRHLKHGLVFENDQTPATKHGSHSPELERYRSASPSKPAQPDALVKLECFHCHELAPRGSANADLTAGLTKEAFLSSGDYMLPVNYERHCSACHPLGYEYELSGQAVQRPVPHGLQADAQAEMLWKSLMQSILSQQKPDAAKEKLEQKPADKLAGEPAIDVRLPQKPPSSPVPTTLAGLVDRLTMGVAQQVAHRCAKCHQHSTDAAVAADATPTGAAPPQWWTPAQAEEVARRFRFEDVHVPTKWFRHAVFSHLPHRAVACQECHATESPTGDATATGALPASASHLDNQRVLIPGRDVCLKCHAPARGTGESATGGARHDCAECHRYHGGAGPDSSPGSPDRDGTSKLRILEFLNAASKGK